MKQDVLAARADKLRARIATAETELATLKQKLAAVESKLFTGPPPASAAPAAAPPPQKTGLDMLWQAALPKARERSSRHRCRLEWNKIPVSQRPALKTLIDALTAWNRCEAWRCDSHAFVPGLHRFIKERMWEDLPEDSRHCVPRPVTKAPAPERTAEDEAALRAFLTRPAKVLARV